MAVEVNQPSSSRQILSSSSSSEPNPREDPHATMRTPSLQGGRGGERRSFSSGGAEGGGGRTRRGEGRGEDQRLHRHAGGRGAGPVEAREGRAGGAGGTSWRLSARDEDDDEDEEEENLRQGETSERHPYCVVWTYLPLVTTLLPFIGHVGVCTAEGVVHDFAGPYTINVDQMAFHRPMKVWKLNPQRMHPPGDATSYDTAVEVADARFRETSHDICCNNCHHHVARALSQMAYDGKRNWSQFDVWWNLAIRGRFLSWTDWLIVWGPWLFIGILALLCGLLVPWLHYP